MSLPARIPIEPGLHRLTWEQYRAIDAVNFSTLKFLARSPLHYRYAIENDVEPTAPMRLGEACHTAVLEPQRFTRDYAIYSVPDGKSDKRGTKLWLEFEQANPGKTLLKQNEFEGSMLIRDAVRSYAPAMRYLRKGIAELTAVWRDAETGILCKARLDLLSQSVECVIAELKSTGSVVPSMFATQYARLSYHAQAAMQCDALEAITGKHHYQKCIVVESKPPHDVIVYDTIEVIDLGRDLYREWLERLAACRASNSFPGIAEGAEMVLHLPAWAAASDDDVTGLGLEFGEEAV